MTDLAWRLKTRGYHAIDEDRAERGGGDDYWSRLLGRRALVVRSDAGVRAFYDESVVSRRGAVPPPLAWLLFGRGAVHGLDEREHRDRKMMLLDVLSPGGLVPLLEHARDGLRAQADGWAERGEVCVHDELVVTYGRAVLAWAGIDLSPDEADTVSRRLALLVDGFGFSAGYPRAWRERLRLERWAAGLVRERRDAGSRDGRTGHDGTALGVLAASGLGDRVAGVELLNVLRPTVAVAWLGAFLVLRLAEHPDWCDRVTERGDPRDRLAFAQEVRRTTPFVPALVARVRRARWVGSHRVSRGDLVVLDVLGVDHDPARWEAPERFTPERFLGVSPSALPGAFDLVPQGGGHPSGHRCPGESLTLCLLDVTLQVLATVPYDAGPVALDLSRIPTLPPDGLRLRAFDADQAGRVGPLRT